VSAAEIIEQLPKLSPAERQAILDKLRELAQVDDDRWEQIINEPMLRPKLKAFIEQATAEGSEPLDLNRM
jgi:acyl-CoA reductase-like NAD-dependent aldehyde dehydrogenase